MLIRECFLEFINQLIPGKCYTEDETIEAYRKFWRDHPKNTIEHYIERHKELTYGITVDMIIDMIIAEEFDNLMYQLKTKDQFYQRKKAMEHIKNWKNNEKEKRTIQS